MVTPNRDSIRRLAQQKEHEQNRNLPYVTSEDSELRENGSWLEARDELMRDNEKAECLSYLEKEALELGYRLIPKAQFNGVTQQKYIELKTLVGDILRFGDLLTIANKGVGKTNALMTLARAFMQNPENRVIVFETFPKWLHEFDSIPYLYIEDEDVTEDYSAIELNEYDYFVRTSKDYTILRGSQIRNALDECKDLLFTLQVEDTDRISFFISSVIYHFYRSHYLTAYKYGLQAIRQRVIFVCEESQNIFDSSIISKKIFNKLRKIYSETRNLKIHFVMASQRIQDLNTKIRGRTRYLVGNVNIDDYDLKVRRILRNSDYKKEVLQFPVGRFLYTPTDSVIQFAKFEQDGKPYDLEKLCASLQPAKPELTLWQKVVKWVGA